MYGVWFYDAQIDLSAQLDAVSTCGCLPERIPSFVCFVISSMHHLPLTQLECAYLTERRQTAQELVASNNITEK